MDNSEHQDNLQKTRESLNIYISPEHEKLLFSRNGKDFELYSFRFYGIGGGKYPNELLYNSKKYQEELGEGNIAIGEDGSGGYFVLRNDGSKQIHFHSYGVERIYAEDADRFFLGLQWLDQQLAKIGLENSKDDPDYEIDEDESNTEIWDELYEKAISYMNNETDQLS